MKIVEILDANGIDSFNIESWITECQRFKKWYCRKLTRPINHVELEKAFLKIQSIQKYVPTNH